MLATNFGEDRALDFNAEVEQVQDAPWEHYRAAQRRFALAAARSAADLPGYRNAWSQAGLTSNEIASETWEQLPFLTKEVLIEAAQNRPPFGDRLGVAKEDIAHVFVAPGPLYMPYTKDDLTHVAGSFAKALRACGLTSTDLVDQTTMYNWVIAATAIDRALQMIGCGVIPGGVGQSERHVDVIRHLNVTAIVAFPTFLEHILEVAEAQSCTLPLRKAVVMGELSHPDMKQKFKEKYALEVREFYGVADVGAVAWECSACSGMHLRDDLLVEFVEPGGSKPLVPTPDTPAELVVTDFRRKAMPIIRLRTGDMIDELTTEPCACGRISPRFRRIVGRSGEITKVKGMFVVPRLVQDVFLHKGINRQFRLVVDRHEGGRDSLVLEIAGTPLPDAEALVAKVEAALRMKLDMAFVDALPENGPRLVDLRLQKRAP